MQDVIECHGFFSTTCGVMEIRIYNILIEDKFRVIFKLTNVQGSYHLFNIKKRALSRFERL